MFQQAPDPDTAHPPMDQTGSAASSTPESSGHWLVRNAAELTRRSVGLAGQSVQAFGSSVVHALPDFVAKPVMAAVDVVQTGGRAVETACKTSADAAMRVTIRLVVEIALSELDLNEIVRNHVDLNALAAQLDIDEVASRIDIGAIVDRVDIMGIVGDLDLDRIVDSVDLNRQINRVDLNAVAERINPDPLVARANLEAVIARIDLIALADSIIDGIDLPKIIRQSTSSISSEAVRGVRSQSMNADDAVAGFMGRLFGKGDASPATST